MATRGEVDNRPENLELMVSGRHPIGQRVTDLAEWAEEVIADYGNDAQALLKVAGHGS